LSSRLCFIPLLTALFHGKFCAFRAQNNKRNNLSLPLIIQCNWRRRNWTRQTLGTCPQCALRSEQENTEIFKQTSLCKTCMEKILEKFKDTRSVSS